MADSWSDDEILSSGAVVHMNSLASPARPRFTFSQFAKSPSLPSLSTAVDEPAPSDDEDDSGLDEVTLNRSDFQGCYCLVSRSENKYYKNRTYIGYTVNPMRRVKQHNRGQKSGGAHRTDNRGPWDMVIIVHGFMHSKDALRFEWAWQHPEKSRRIQSLDFRKRAKETQFEHRFRLATLIMSTAPWSRMPLTLRWLKPFYKLPYPQNTLPMPGHMMVTEGPPEQVCVAPTADYGALARLLDASPPCAQCGKNVATADMLVACVTCVKLSHWRCAADVAHARTDNEDIPLLRKPNARLPCKRCGTRSEWHALVRRTRALERLVIDAQK